MLGFDYVHIPKSGSHIHVSKLSDAEAYLRRVMPYFSSFDRVDLGTIQGCQDIMFPLNPKFNKGQPYDIAYVDSVASSLPVTKYYLIKSSNTLIQVKSFSYLSPRTLRLVLITSDFE